MREILFKAKRIDNGEWVQGWYMETIIGIIVATTVAVVSAFLWGFTSNDLFLGISIVSAFTTSAAVYHGGR